jgi:hypoxanthine phosphoribosyltransferase
MGAKLEAAMERDIDRILITDRQVARRVAELADEIADCYPDQDTGLILVPILSGSIIFLADLIRLLPMKMKLGMIAVSSYGGATTTSRGPRLELDLKADVSDQHVLIVDDILDTGGTLRFVQSQLEAKRPRSLRTVVLLRKPGKAPPDVVVDFVGFDISDEFVVGCGLDYDGHYRNFPHIAVLKQECY